jgi:hypothetical protein
MPIWGFVHGYWRKEKESYIDAFEKIEMQKEKMVCRRLGYVGGLTEIGRTVRKQ